MIRSRLHFIGIVLAICVFPVGQVVGAPAKDKVPSTSPNDAEARAHFKAGAQHFDNGDYREAYDEFRKAMLLKKTRALMGFAASSLRQMGRYDEALDLYEAILHDYPDLPADFRAKVDTAIADLTKLVGTLSLAGDAPAGAALFLDDRPRGTLPLASPIRVAQGMHVVRVQKEGFDPIQGSIEIGPEKANTLTLVAKSKPGRLVVSEKRNWPLAVEIDGKDVGITPWQGYIEPGEHRLRVHGFIPLVALAECAAPESGVLAQSGAKMETPEQKIAIQSFETTTVTLGAEDTDASLHIESTPPGASLQIDGQSMGKTPWEGRLPLGEHALELRAKGFYATKQAVMLERRKSRDLAITLEREPDRAAEERAARKAKVGVALAYGVGGIGLGMFGVAGGLALRDRNILRARCVNGQCPSTEDDRVREMNTLGNISTIGAVITGLGAAAGTTLFLLTRPEERKGPKGPSMHVGMGLTGVIVKGEF